MNNLVSVRIQNKYKTSFSLSHYLKHSHSTIDKKIKTYCLNNNLDYKNLKYEHQYQIIKSINKINYVINCKNRSKPDTNVGVRPDAKTEFNRTVKRS